MAKPKTIKQSVEELVHQNASDFVAKLPARVNQIMEAALLSLLGIEKRGYNSYEVDHCNGRNSVFIDVLREMAKKEAVALTKGLKLPPGEFQLIREAFIKEFKSAIWYEIRDLAKARAKELAQELVGSIDLKGLGKLTVE